MASRLAARQGQEDRFGANAMRLFEADGYGEFSPELQSAVAYRALKPAIASGRAELVSQTLGVVRNPNLYSDLLASRDYERAWPAIEARVGEHYTQITEEYRHWALARLENEPTDRDRFSDAAHALFYDGRFEEAAALARKWRERPGAFERIEEGDG